MFKIIPSFDLAGTHSAVIVCWEKAFDTAHNSKDPLWEAMIYTPHGISPNCLQLLTDASPRIEPLILVHGMHEVSVGWLGQISELLQNLSHTRIHAFYDRFLRGVF